METTLQPLRKRWTGLRALGCGICLLAALVGAPAARAADPDWFGVAPRDVSASAPNRAWRPDVAVGPDGRVAMVWSDDPTGAGQSHRDIYVALSEDAGRSFSAPQVITDTASESMLPDVVIAGEQVFVAWAEKKVVGFDPTFTIYEAELQPGGGGWEVHSLPVAPWAAATRPQIAAGAGRLHMVFNAGSEGSPNIYYAARPLGGNVWSAPTLVYTHTAPSGSWYPALAVSRNGQTLHVVWEERTSSQVRAVMVLRGTVTGGGVDWHYPATTLSTGVTLPLWPAVAVGEDGIPHVVWGERAVGQSSMCGTAPEQYVRYTRLSSYTGRWLEPAARVDAAPVCVNLANPTDLAPSLTLVERQGRWPDVCVAWHGFRSGGGAEEVLLSCSPYSPFAWSPPQNVSRSYENDAMSIIPSLAADAQGQLHIAWQERTGDSAILDYQTYYARSPYRVFVPGAKIAAQSVSLSYGVYVPLVGREFVDLPPKVFLPAVMKELF